MTMSEIEELRVKIDELEEELEGYDFGSYLYDVANGELEWRSVLNKFYHSFKDDLENANMDDGMRPNKPTPISLVCPQCEKDNLMIRNSSNGVFLGCQGYNNAKEEQCKKTLNLISGEEAVSIDDQQEASNLFIKKRCKICDLSMDNYLIDEYKKLPAYLAVRLRLVTVSLASRCGRNILVQTIWRENVTQQYSV